MSFLFEWKMQCTMKKKMNTMHLFIALSLLAALMNRHTCQVLNAFLYFKTQDYNLLKAI